MRELREEAIMDAIYGVREDGSVWISLGDSKTGPHCQFDLLEEFEAKLICDTFNRVQTLEDALRHVLEVTELPDRETYLSEYIKQALATKNPMPNEFRPTARQLFCRIVADVPTVDRIKAIAMVAKTLNRSPLDVGFEIGISNIQNWQPKRNEAANEPK